MIARYWRGRVRSRDAEAYAAYVRRTGVAQHRGTAGNVSSMVLVRHELDEAEVVVISLWDSLEDVRGFAGDPIERAVFFPEDDQYLIARDLVAYHFEVPAYEGGSGASSQAPVPVAIPHRVYSDGRVQSLGFASVTGDATVGVIAPGTHEFTTTTGEHVTLLDGTAHVWHSGTSRLIRTGESYSVPAGIRFEVRAEVPVAYLCRFVPVAAP